MTPGNSGSLREGTTRASIGLRGDAGRGTPDIDRREEKRIKRYRRDRTGSALVSM
jgi:hypothetical protein